jgi:hypothetical protein
MDNLVCFCRHQNKTVILQVFFAHPKKSITFALIFTNLSLIISLLK